jgi:hypothetical protein
MTSKRRDRISTSPPRLKERKMSLVVQRSQTFGKGQTNL